MREERIDQLVVISSLNCNKIRQYTLFGFIMQHMLVVIFHAPNEDFVTYFLSCVFQFIMHQKSFSYN